MNAYLAAKSRRDTRGMHHTHKAVSRDMHKALARYEYGWWSRHYRAFKKMMEGK
tara:strand:- start:34564 stop:34725 length:162 start_codon:yes stop_codon:yes gene_type:complete